MAHIASKKTWGGQWQTPGSFFVAKFVTGEQLIASNAPRFLAAKRYTQARTSEISYIQNMRTKEKIIEKIQNIEDESILEDLLEIIDLELDMVGDTVQLSDDQKSAIDEGLKDIQEGRLYSNEEARKMVDEWMKKR